MSAFRPATVLPFVIAVGDRYGLGISVQIIARFMQSPLNRFPESLRIALLGAIYAVLITASFWLSYEVRFDFAVPENYRTNRLFGLLYVLPLKLLCLWAFGQFRGLLSFFRIPDLTRLSAALLVVAVICFGIRQFQLSGLANIPRGVILADLLFSTYFIAGFRMVLRLAREKQSEAGREVPKHRLLIIGAGSTGAHLAAELLARPQLGQRPVAFLDDDPEKVGRQIHGVPIFGKPDQLTEAAETFEATRVAIAIPALKAHRIREILQQASEVQLETVIVPGLHELSAGDVRIEEMRKIEVEDLLGRERVRIETESIQQMLEGETILVTGAGGSIGAELVHQISTVAVRHLVLVDSSEQALFEILENLRSYGRVVSLDSHVADFRNRAAMENILKRTQPSILFHAAAYKHVPLMEAQPWEAVANNSLGTLRLAGMAQEFGVERFVLISTDKAINPTSVMGASKRLAEIGIQAICQGGERWGQELRAESGERRTQDGEQGAEGGELEPASLPDLPKGRKRTRFMAVRFGNVLGSSGSVIPTFRRQIARGGPVTVTHPDVTRYFMTIPEAVGLVLQSAALGEGGEIFLLDMGEPVKIMDLARQMIQLSGFEPDTEIEIEVTGLRPGEKLFEELNYDTEASEETTHPRIRRLRVQPRSCDDVHRWFASLEEDLLGLDPMELKERIKEMVPEYTPFVE